MKKIRVNIYLSPKQKADLDKISEKTGAPVAELVRRSIDAYLKANKA
jgi:predicted DNA-binding protein